MNTMLSVTLFTGIVMSVRLSIPVLYAALGGVISERAGIFNIALEGMMLAGAFFGYYGSLISGSPTVGLLLALAAGGLTGLLLAFTSVTLGVSQLVVGLGINILFMGLTGYLYRLISGGGLTAVATMYRNIRIPLLSDIPVLGEIFFSHNILVYIGILVVAVMSFYLYRTTSGLSLRSVGEHPLAAETAGINVYRVRYLATIVGGMLAAAGGAFLTLTQVSRFLENMVEGRGWIALTAVILGKRNPWGVFAASLLFGAANALSNQMQIIGIKLPYQITLMVPYVLTMVVLSGVVGKIRKPAATGKPYGK